MRWGTYALGVNHMCWVTYVLGNKYMHWVTYVYGHICVGHQVYALGALRICVGYHMRWVTYTLGNMYMWWGACICIGMIVYMCCVTYVLGDICVGKQVYELGNILVR